MGFKAVSGWPAPAQKGSSDLTGSLVVRVDSLRLELDHQGGDVVLFRQFNIPQYSVNIPGHPTFTLQNAIFRDTQLSEYSGTPNFGRSIPGHPTLEGVFRDTQLWNPTLEYSWMEYSGTPNFNFGIFRDTQLSLFKHVIGIPLLFSSKSNYPIAPVT
jgi:hypothetical protein